MMRAAPAMRAPCTTAWPTPPQPSTATVEPGWTAAVLSAAPTPVVTPQPISASCSSGTSPLDLTTECSLVVTASAKVPSPVMQMYGEPSERVPRGVIIVCGSSSQWFDWSCRQNQQMPQAGTNEAMTRSPFLTAVTSLPTSTTRARCPRGRG